MGPPLVHWLGGVGFDVPWNGSYDGWSAGGDDGLSPRSMDRIVVGCAACRRIHRVEDGGGGGDVAAFVKGLLKFSLSFGCKLRGIGRCKNVGGERVC